jgi:chaperonin cofactor prefoldin
MADDLNKTVAKLEKTVEALENKVKRLEKRLKNGLKRNRAEILKLLNDYEPKWDCDR